MKKGLKIAGIIVAVILVLMIVLPFAFRGKIEGLVKSEGNKMLNAQFDFDKLSISLFKNFPKASITIEDFWLKGINEFENDTLVHAGELTATVNLMSLLGNSGYEVSKIAIVNTYAKAIVLADGKANWDIMKPSDSEETTKETTEDSASFSVKLNKLILDNVNIIYDDRQGNMYAEIKKLGATCSGDLGSDQTVLKLEAETPALYYKMGGVPFLNGVNFYAKMNVDADLKNMKFTLAKNELRLNAIKAGIDGWIAMIDPAMDMDLTLNTSEVGFKEILSLVPAIYSKEFKDLKTEGTATLSAHAKGILQGDTVPQFNASIEVKNAMFQYPTLPAGVDQINISAKASNPGGSADLTIVEVNPFKFRLANNPFSMTAEVKTPISDAAFNVNTNGVLDLGKIKDVYPLEEMELNGIVNADFAMAGRMSYIENEQYDRLTASGNIKLTDMKLKMKDIPDVDIHQSIFTFTPKRLQLSETTVNIGQNDITADCYFENYMGFALKDNVIKGKLNISSNLFNLNDFMSGEETTTTTDTVPMNLIEIPKNVDFDMTVNMKKVVFGAMNIDNIKGDLKVNNGIANMKGLSMNTMGGNIVMNGHYSTADIEKPEVDASFKMTDLSFAQTYKELDMVKQMAPIFEGLKGTYSGSMTVQTLLDKQMSPVLNTMQGNGNLSTKDLNLSGVDVIDKIADAVGKEELKNISVKDMNLDFEIKEGRLYTDPFDIKFKDYVMNLSGSTGLDQTVDYSGKIQLPASAGKVASLTTFDLKITGEMSSPKVGVDLASMGKQAVTNVAESLLDKVLGSNKNDSTATDSTATDTDKGSKTKDAIKGLLDKIKK
ncbi:AsmA family protein [Bacteroides sp. 214]|uniref:AsmA family protein n=1 Tax=Bacteroides sp. 214 TaxID=2302935 RepID=UPI0013D68BC6|nr:AsmA-like C-terminal region-containing protein [Bacteroides sp. 214]NDW11663.1 AsmA family protein [Bacteroides sp. 214]